MIAILQTVLLLHGNFPPHLETLLRADSSLHRARAQSLLLKNLELEGRWDMEASECEALVRFHYSNIDATAA